MKRLIIILLIALCGSALAAFPHNAFNDSIEVSLLTCEPGPAVYEHYGHTALRVRTVGDSIAQPYDLVFNYGCFDFNTPNFALRFVLGKTDYFLGVLPYVYFEYEYVMANRRVWQQTLHLTAYEKQKMIDRLSVDCRPENCVYRYNFLYNNCTTKCRDMIEQAVNGEVRWPQDNRKLSLRDIMHQYNSQHPWASMGIDLLLGGSIDRSSTVRERMFAPMYMMDYLSSATVIRADSIYQLADSAVAIVNPAVPYVAHGNEGFAWGLMLLITMVIALLATSCIINKWYGVLNWVIVLVFFVIGVLGIIPTFLFFFSEHPAVDTNLQVLVFNPLPLVLLFLGKSKYSFYIARAAIFMAAIALIFGTYDGFGHSSRPVVMLQYVPGSIELLILIYMAALIGFLFLGFGYLNKENLKFLTRLYFKRGK